MSLFCPGQPFRASLRVIPREPTSTLSAKLEHVRSSIDKVKKNIAAPQKEGTGLQVVANDQCADDPAFNIILLELTKRKENALEKIRQGEAATRE